MLARCVYVQLIEYVVVIRTVVLDTIGRVPIQPARNLSALNSLVSHTPEDVAAQISTLTGSVISSVHGTQAQSQGMPIYWFMITPLGAVPSQEFAHKFRGISYLVSG